MSTLAFFSHRIQIMWELFEFRSKNPQFLRIHRKKRDSYKKNILQYFFNSWHFIFLYSVLCSLHCVRLAHTDTQTQLVVLLFIRKSEFPPSLRFLKNPPKKGWYFLRTFLNFLQKWREIINSTDFVKDNFRRDWEFSHVFLSFSTFSREACFSYKLFFLYKNKTCTRYKIYYGDWSSVVGYDVWYLQQSNMAEYYSFTGRDECGTVRYLDIPDGR